MQRAAGILRFAQDDSACSPVLGLARCLSRCRRRLRADAGAGAGDRRRRQRRAHRRAATPRSARGDDRLAAFVQALLDDEVKVAGDKVFIVHDGKASDAASGAAGDAARRRRGRHQQQPHARRARGRARRPARPLARRSRCARGAVDELAKASLDESQLPLIEKALRRRDRPGAEGRSSSGCARRS